jgi:hypothetical protein
MTTIFILLTFAVIIIYDIAAYLVGKARGVGARYTISTWIYRVAHLPAVANPVFPTRIPHVPSFGV